MRDSKSQDHEPDTFEKAKLLINHHPYSPDIIKQLDRLRVQTPKPLRENFDWYYEGVIAGAETEEELRYVTGWEASK